MNRTTLLICAGSIVAAIGYLFGGLYLLQIDQPAQDFQKHLILLILVYGFSTILLLGAFWIARPQLSNQGIDTAERSQDAPAGPKALPISGETLMIILGIIVAILTGLLLFFFPEILPSNAPPSLSE